MPQISQSDLNPQILYWLSSAAIEWQKKKKKTLVKDFCFRAVTHKVALAVECALAGALKVPLKKKPFIFTKTTTNPGQKSTNCDVLHNSAQQNRE